ncbi:MAG TPA: histidine kinase dimerization/phospho-acceptor domain-containing protein [Gemmatimonadales bacterium]|nr:histidine kinase dimerization/phospho-acceptor domain-containing protein [Gemmatimonadales bacterium]
MADPHIADRLARLRHDLSNPLSAILAETQLLLLNQDKYDEETVSTLKQIEVLARRMREILLSLG